MGNLDVKIKLDLKWLQWGNDEGLREYLNSSEVSALKEPWLLHKRGLFMRQKANSSCWRCTLGITGGKSIKEESDCANT